MSGIYLRDLDVKRVGDRIEGTRRPIDVLLPILKLITPRDIVVTRQFSTPLGTRINYAHPQDANLIYNPRVIATLTTHNLKAQLSNLTAINRQVWLIDTPEIIYNKDIPSLNEDIRRSINTRLLEIRKYENQSGRKYLILTTNSQADRDALLATGHI